MELVQIETDGFRRTQVGLKPCFGGLDLSASEGFRRTQVGLKQLNENVREPLEKEFQKNPSGIMALSVVSFIVVFCSPCSTGHIYESI